MLLSLAELPCFYLLVMHYEVDPIVIRYIFLLLIFCMASPESHGLLSSLFLYKISNTPEKPLHSPDFCFSSPFVAGTP